METNPTELAIDLQVGDRILFEGQPNEVLAVEEEGGWIYTRHDFGWLQWKPDHVVNMWEDA